MAKRHQIDPDLPVVFAPIGRKSHKDKKRDQKLTEGEQRRSCLNWCEDQARLVGDSVTLPWRFDDETGTRADREDYQAWLADLRAQRQSKHNVVAVVRQFDRLGRDGEELYRVEREVKNLGVQVFDLKLGRFIHDEDWSDLIADAVKYGRTIGANVRRTNADLRRQGWWRPGPTAWGMRLRAADEHEEANGAPGKVLEPDPIERQHVETLFNAASQGATLHALSRWAADVPATERRNRPLSVSNLRDTLRRRVYVGQFDDGTMGNWPAIIDERTFNRVQEQLQSHERPAGRPASDQVLMGGLLRCGKCGAPMHRWSHGSLVGRSPRYRCSGRENGTKYDPHCTFTCLQSVIDLRVLSQVEPLLAPIFAMGADELAKALRDAETHRAASAPERRLRVVETRLREISDATSSVRKDKAEGRIEDWEYQATMSDYRTERAALVTEQAELQRSAGSPHKQPAGALLMEHATEWRDWWYSGDQGGRKSVLAGVAKVVRAWRDDTAPAGIRVMIEPTDAGRALAAVAGVNFD